MTDLLLWLGVAAAIFFSIELGRGGPGFRLHPVDEAWRLELRHEAVNELVGCFVKDVGKL